uniref:FH2 domain-containing protein n=1 Tax=Lactuca sativa TaxID=4236 RepID=A0A9R1XJ06_LACSA|nr:hypothetical protein LSAT_V11C300152410 [Lactuca sativa]
MYMVQFIESDRSSRHGMSKIRGEFMVGVLHHVPPILDFTAPIPNSICKLLGLMVYVVRFAPGTNFSDGGFNLQRTYDLESSNITSKNNSPNGQILSIQPVEVIFNYLMFYSNFVKQTRNGGFGTIYKDQLDSEKIDISELENLFSAAIPLDKNAAKSKSAQIANKPEKVQLIDHRRAYNCEIMLSKVNIPLHELMHINFLTSRRYSVDMETSCTSDDLTCDNANLEGESGLRSKQLRKLLLFSRNEAADYKAPQSERGMKSRAILGRQVKGIVTEQIIEVESGLGPYEIEYDEEWLSITHGKGVV